MSDFLAVLFAASVVLLVGFIVGAGIMQDRSQEEAVSKGYAEYCSTTGDWAWKGKCSK